MPRIWVLISAMTRRTGSELSGFVRFTSVTYSVVPLASVGMLFLWFSVAWGDGTPTQAVKDTIDEVLTVLGDEALKDSERRTERREKLESVIGQRFDYEEMAKRTLGKQWKQIGVEKKQEFVGLFQQFLSQSYAGNIGSYSGQQVKYLRERLKGDFSEVQTKIVSANVQLPVDYRLLKKNKKWSVYDVIIDGVSLTKNYRGQFSRIIKSSSFDTLLEKLRSKTDLAASS